ncbi:MAG: RNA polymerase sigma factor [Thermoanaerobaculia bacterium]|nr:RNA polymerase sigma factor [Thermoanaerobaculia bacterium]
MRLFSWMYAESPPWTRHQVAEDTGDRAFACAFRELASGRRSAGLEQLYRLCARDLYGLALWRTGNSADAEDVVQEVFVKLSRAGKKLARVRHGRRYLLTMTHRTAIDRVRRRRRDEPPTDELLQPVVERPERRLDAQRLSAWLVELPPAQREAVYLRIYQDLSFAEVGRITGVPTFTAASRYRLAVQRLRRRMEAEA